MLRRAPFYRQFLKKCCNGHRNQSNQTTSSKQTKSSNEAHYIEDWQKSCVKANSFYEKHAEERTYFYTSDLLGRLFLEETSPKNIATSLKSDIFLDFFHKQIQRNDTHKHLDYPYYSPCGLEHNYIRPADVAIVFHDLQDRSLIFGGSLQQEFEPNELAFSPNTGRFYHRLFGTKMAKAKSKLQKEGTQFGLLKSTLSQFIAEEVELDNDGQFVLNGRPIPHLPPSQESTDWGLPPLTSST